MYMLDLVFPLLIKYENKELPANLFHFVIVGSRVFSGEDGFNPRCNEAVTQQNVERLKRCQYFPHRMFESAGKLVIWRKSKMKSDPCTQFLFFQPKAVPEQLC